MLITVASGASFSCHVFSSNHLPRVNFILCRHLDVTSDLLFSRTVSFGSFQARFFQGEYEFSLAGKKSQDFVIPALYGLVVCRMFHLILTGCPFSFNSQTLLESVVLHSLPKFDRERLRDRF